MASLESRDGNFRTIFRLEGEKVARSLGTRNQKTANLRFAQVEHRLEQHKLGCLAIPSGCDPVEFILNGSKKPLAAPTRKSFRESVTIKRAWAVFKEALPDNTLEDTTLSGMETHVAHLARLPNALFCGVHGSPAKRDPPLRTRRSRLRIISNNDPGKETVPW